MEGYHMRPARPGDCDQLFSLIKELAVFVKCGHEVVIDAKTLQRDCFENSYFHCLVTEFDKDVVGYVLYYFTYSPLVGRCVYMEDFYVKPEHRNKGLGTSLWKSLIKDAVENGCKKIEWAVSKWNIQAVEFYKRSGAIDLTEKKERHVLQLDETKMHKMLEQ